MFKKFFISCLCIMYMLVIIFTNISIAAVTVTEQNLSSALQSFVTSEANEDNYNITMENNIINIDVNNKRYSMNYDLLFKPTFTMEVLIEKGISYNEFNDKTENLILPMLGYIAVANIQGVELEDASSYFLFSYMASALSSGDIFSGNNLYTVVDDVNIDEGVTIQKTDDPKTIYVSEFGDRVIEYVNAVYAETATVTDSTGINSYTMSLSKENISDSSCKIISKVEVNTDADFSPIKGYADQMADSFMDTSITEENADIFVSLKVGQKCKLVTSGEVTGYSLNSNNCIELSEDRTEITATATGKTNGYIYLDGGQQKSIYVIVEEDLGIIDLKDVTVYLDTNSNMPEDDNSENVNNTYTEEPNYNYEEEEPKNSTTTNLPQTGIENSYIIILWLAGVLIIMLSIKLNKLKDI